MELEEKISTTITILSWNVQRLADSSDQIRHDLFEKTCEKIYRDYKPDLTFLCEVGKGFIEAWKNRYQMQPMFAETRVEFYANKDKNGGTSPCSYALVTSNKLNVEVKHTGQSTKRPYLEVEIRESRRDRDCRYVIGFVHALAGWGEDRKGDEMFTIVTNLLSNKLGDRKALIGDLNIEAKEDQSKVENVVTEYKETIMIERPKRATYKKETIEKVLDYVIHTKNMTCIIEEEPIKEYEDKWGIIDHAPLVCRLGCL